MVTKSKKKVAKKQPKKKASMKKSTRKVVTQETGKDSVEKHIKNQAAQEYVASMVRSKIVFENVSFTAHRAETPSQKIAGLEIADSLEEKEGMIFLFDKPQFTTFHMGKVKFPIDIVFLTATKKGYEVLSVEENVQPGSDEKFSHHDVSLVLELNGGTCEKYKIAAGTVCTEKLTVSLNKDIF